MSAFGELPRKLYSIVLSLLLPAVSANAVGVTSLPFCEHQLLQSLHRVIQFYPRADVLSTAEEEKVIDTYDSSLRRVLRTRTYTYSDQIIRITRPEIREGPTHTFSTDSSTDGLAHYRTDIRDWVDFAIEQYGRRGWQKAMFAELANLAQRYAFQSVYISSYAPNQPPSPRTLWGVYRQIHAPYGSTREFGEDLESFKRQFWMRTGVHYFRAACDAGPRILFPFPGAFAMSLPLEELLNGGQLLVPRTSHFQWQNFTQELDAVVEPGNWAVSKIGGKKVVDRILYHVGEELLPQYQSREITRRGDNLFTYAGEVSRNLYRPKNLEPLSQKTWQAFGEDWQVLWGNRNGFVHFLEGQLKSLHQ